MEPTFYADILFFAVVAGFIAFRLYSVLGRKDGTEQNLTHRVKEMWDAKTPAGVAKEASKPAANGIPADAPAADAVSFEDVSEEAQPTIIAIMEKDRNFIPEQFLAGAQAAFEIILAAFAEGNKETLKSLLDPSLYAEFEADIARREAAGETLSTTLVALVRAEIVSADLKNTQATLEVSFESEQISCTTDKEGAVLSGNATLSERLHDTWTFQRDLGSRNPTWLLTDTDVA